MSTFSSRVMPVLTSNNSGARYAIVLCSAAISYGHQVRGTWTGRIAESPSWAHDVQARIYLRSLNGGAEPLDEDVDQLLAENKDVIKTVTEDQVATAFLCGEEVSGY